MKKSLINIMLATLILLPVLSSARKAIGSDTDPGVQIWIGGWYSPSGTYHTVTGHSFIRCDSLLEEATEGQDVIINECHRA